MIAREGFSRVLSDAQIQQFIDDGFVRIDEAFPRHLADEGRTILWRDLPCDPDDPATWTRPVIRLGWYADAPFREAVNSPVLQAAYDQLVGHGRWRPRKDLGSFPVRFPSEEDPEDTGWHIDVSFPGPNSSWEEQRDFSDWRANVSSRGRALLMLFLFSDVGEADAPTRIKAGSHRDIARILAPAGEAGMSNAMLDPHLADIERPEVSATGRAGTVYLCHPFLVHAAQMHRGSHAAFHGAAAVASGRAVADRSRGRRLFSGRARDQSSACRNQLGGRSGALPVIARSAATKQSSFRVEPKLDCFASLAMTGCPIQWPESCAGRPRWRPGPRRSWWRRRHRPSAA